MVAPARRIIPAPPVTPLPYTLMSVADVRDNEPRVLFGVEYPTDACVTATEAPEWCATPPVPQTKTPLDGQFYAESVQFPIYSLMRCRLVGSDLNEERASNVLQLNEARGVEAGFMRHFLAAPTSVPLGTIAAVNVTPVPGTPVCPELGLALLEGYAAQHYAGLPVIHAGRTVASLMGSRNQIVSDRGALATRLGARVAAGGGYDLTNLAPNGGAAPAAGTTWMYVTGQVTILRGDITTSGLVMGQNVTAPNIGAYNNEFDVFAERGYAALGECVKAAVLVSVDCEVAA